MNVMSLMNQGADWRLTDEGIPVEYGITSSKLEIIE